MDPLTLLLLGGGALLLAGRRSTTKQKGDAPKSNSKKLPPSCPPGFFWDQQALACVPSDEGPAQVHVLGLCEAWQLLPSRAGWLEGWVRPVLQQTAESIGAQPSPGSPDLVGQEESLTPDVLAHIALSQSPIAYSGPEFPTLGLLCKLPYSESLGPDPAPGQQVPQAMIELHQYVTDQVAPAVAAFNDSGVAFQFPETA